MNKREQFNFRCQPGDMQRLKELAEYFKRSQSEANRLAIKYLHDAMKEKDPLELASLLLQ